MNILKLNEIYDLNCSKFIYNCFNNETYVNFKVHLVPNSHYHNYNTRSKEQIRKPFERLSQFNHTFLNNGITIWNNLPQQIKSVKTLQSFKNRYKKLLFLTR